MINRLREDRAAAAELGVITTAMRKSEFRYVFNPERPQQLISQEVHRLVKSGKMDIDEALEYVGTNSKMPHSFDIESPTVAEFLRTHAQINHVRSDKMTTLMNAMGLTRNVGDEPIVYVPPIDTVRYPYHAFVRTKEKLSD